MEFALRTASKASADVEKPPPQAAKTDVYPSSSSISTMLFDGPATSAAHPAASAPAHAPSPDYSMTSEEAIALSLAQQGVRGSRPNSRGHFLGRIDDEFCNYSLI